MPGVKIKRKGTTALYMIGIIAVLGILCTSVLTTSMHSFRTSVKMKETLQALHLARAGIVLAEEKLKKNPEYKGEGPVKSGRGEIEIRIKIINEQKIIVSTGYFPSKKKARQQRVIRRFPNI
jgi:hypothetical protein